MFLVFIYFFDNIFNRSINFCFFQQEVSDTVKVFVKESETTCSLFQQIFFRFNDFSINPSDTSHVVEKSDFFFYIDRRIKIYFTVDNSIVNLVVCNAVVSPYLIEQFHFFGVCFVVSYYHRI